MYNYNFLKHFLFFLEGGGMNNGEGNLRSRPWPYHLATFKYSCLGLDITSTKLNQTSLLRVVSNCKTSLFRVRIHNRAQLVVSNWKISFFRVRKIGLSSVELGMVVGASGLTHWIDGPAPCAGGLASGAGGPAPCAGGPASCPDGGRKVGRSWRTAAPLLTRVWETLVVPHVRQ